MSKPKVFEKPVGVKDYLPEAVAKLRRIETSVLQCMERWGYREIITPTLEYYDTVGVASSTEDRKLFKLLDRNGTTLVMRSDMTSPIARVVASLLKEQPFPLRLSYRGNVFRAFEAEAGRDAEFFQTGGELVGDASAEADAEVVALAVACLQAAGVQEFKMAIGHVGFLNGLLRDLLGDRPEAQTLLKECLLNRDHVGYREAIKQLGLPEHVKSKLAGILKLRGGEEVCRQAEQATEDPEALASISHLCEVWNVLQAYGVSDRVLIDLTMIGDFSYYTGMTFEGYSADLGFPVCNGGRYDNLLKQFGRPAPATGFALKTSRILEVADEEDAAPLPILIVYKAPRREEAFRRAAELRNGKGGTVVTRLLPDGSDRMNVERGPDGMYRTGGASYKEMIEYC